MAIVALTTIKNWFKTGQKPTQAQFWDVWDSFRHKGETVPVSEVSGIDELLLAKASVSSVDVLREQTETIAIAMDDVYTKEQSDFNMAVEVQSRVYSDEYLQEQINDLELLKLDAADYNQHFKGVYLTEAALNAAHPAGSVGDYAQVNEIGATDVVNYNWDAEENVWIANAIQNTPISNTDALPEGSTNLYFTVARFLTNLTFANIVAALGYTPSTAPNDAQKNSDITKAEIEAKLTGEITSHTHPAVGGGGDMVLASDQTVSGVKTFLSGKFGLRNVANTFTSFFTNANTAARTYTLQNRDGTLLDNTDLSTINTSIATKMANPAGTANYLSKFLTATTIGLSRLWDTGTFLGIGTANAPTKDITLGNQANREIGVELSDSTSIGRDLIISAGKTINYSISNYFIITNEINRIYTGLSFNSNNDMYACVQSGDIYKKINGGALLPLNQTSRYWNDISCHPNGNVYATVNDIGIFMQTAGTGNFALIKSGNFWSIGCHPNGNVYASVYGGDIFMQTAGAGNFVALGQVSKSWRGFCFDNSGNVFVSAYNGGEDIWKQTAGTGNFVPQGLISKNCGAMIITPNNNLYFAEYGTGNIYMRTNNIGSLNLIGKYGTSIFSMSSDTFGNVYAGHGAWGAGAGDIYKQNNVILGFDNLDGGTLKSKSGTGKGTGKSRIEFYTGQKTVSGTDMQVETLREYIDENGYHVYTSTPVYADNAAAIAGGLPIGCEYRTAVGVKMIVY